MVTPYADEPAATLLRCHNSVRAQTHACTHIMVADGAPRAEVAGWAVEHTALPRRYADNGNTPRGIGAILAWNGGFDAVAFLDADNWYAPDHVASLVALCRRDSCAVGFSDRQIVLGDGELVAVPDPEDAARAHVDTSCMFFTAAAARLTTAWAMMDQPLSPVGDRVMLALIRHAGLPHGWSGQRTLFFRSLYAHHYRLAGRPPPDDLHAVDADRLLRDYSPARSAERIGIRLDVSRLV
ncbi:glycosyltransferase [Roseomonas sp. BN140053]|uniref:glycosyltransferase n=1 Tax=Roseomonas sp. BN140053 TaxID=3391898 RepID=UPI0039ED7591